MNAMLRRRRVLASTGATLILTTAFVGWMHTSSGLRFLAAAGVPCPVNKVTADQVTGLRRAGLASVRGGEPAAQRPVPAGLRLDATTEAQARALLAHAGGQCQEQLRGYRYLRCRGVGAAALAMAGPSISEMWLSFDPAGHLASVDIYRRGMVPADVRTVWSEATGRLRAALGTPSQTLGNAAPEVLAAQPVQVARVQYRYADYIATVTASHLPQAGLSVREQYLSARM